MSNTLMTIPFCQLKRSKSNVRKTEPLANIEELAASIEANGVLENLIVVPVDRPGSADSTFFEVIAGGRRLAALKLLVKRKKIARDVPVPCLVLEVSDGISPVQVSLAENIVRAPVHPADQFDAFSALQKEGLPAEDIAARFGLSPIVVVQRLKLAAVSSRLMAVYRTGEMTLEQLMAFTISDDHLAQEQAWFENPFGDSSPQAIRRLLTRSHVEGHDRRARFVGANAYEEAGGTIVRDLFDAENEGYFTDSQLLDRLTAEKLQAEAEKIKAEGWSWVETSLETDFGRLARFGRLKVTEIALPDEDECRLTALCERYDELVAAIEEDDNTEISAELDRVSSELDAFRARKEVWPEDEKCHAGAILSLDHDGQLQIARGLIQPEKELRSKKEEPRAEIPKAKKEKGANAYSDSLLTDLTAHYTMALRETLAGHPAKALIALLHALVLRILLKEPSDGCLELAPGTTELGAFSQTVGESKAAAALLARHNRWLSILPDRTDLWGWLEGLNPSERHELLAYCISLTVNAVHRSWDSQERHWDARVLAQAVALDMADWWRPTAGGFFEHITKDQVLRAVEEGVSREAALRLADRKKGQMANAAAELLANTRWIPHVMRNSLAEEPPAAEENRSAAAE